jgi:hypothetical protein
MQYGELIQRAARLTWRHKVLWVFGIALALVSGGGANGVNYSFNRNDMPWTGSISPAWEDIVAAAVALAVLAAVFVLVLIVVTAIVRYTSVGALIGLVDGVERTQEVTFREGLRRGWRHLLQLFLVALILGLIAALIAFVVVLVFGILIAVLVLPAVLALRAGDTWEAAGIVWLVIVGVVGVALLVLAAILFAAVYNPVREYAFRYVVLRGMGATDAIGEGYRLLRRRLKESVWYGIVLGLIELAIGIVLLPIALVVGGTGAGLAVLLWRASNSPVWPALVAVPLVILGIALAALIQGVYEAFASAAWTLAFRELEPEAA